MALAALLHCSAHHGGLLVEGVLLGGLLIHSLLSGLRWTGWGAGCRLLMETCGEDAARWLWPGEGAPLAAPSPRGRPEPCLPGALRWRAVLRRGGARAG